MYCCVKSMGVTGIDSYIVNVEININRGMPHFDIVGLPDAAVKESKDRVKAAIGNLGFSTNSSQIVVNLAPANTKKMGPIYDLPILMGILYGGDHCTLNLDNSAFIGEISLNGDLRPIVGVLAMVMAAKEDGCKRVFIPAANAAEGSAIEGIDVYPAETVEDIIAHLQSKKTLKLASHYDFPPVDLPKHFDLHDVKGHFGPKRALEIAAAGGHNVLLIGSPGTGKSMLAKRMPSILPPMTFEEAVQSTKVHSVAGMLPKNQPLLAERPFRSPHHSVSAAGLSGGGSNPVPGEISLAHNGILFLDELPEFGRATMEALRQPLEDGEVTISRASSRVTYPSSFILVAAMNPCPCGYFGHRTTKCTCGPTKAKIYLNKVSGPLLDRIDIQIEIPPLPYEKLSQMPNGESSSAIRERVTKARELQQKRYKEFGIGCNANITPAMLQEFCRLTPEADEMMAKVFDKLGFSGRSYDRLLKITRTIADLAGEPDITAFHIGEAVHYRSLDRKYWKRDFKSETYNLGQPGRTLE